jgi:homocitrate synthase NifV
MAVKHTLHRDAGLDTPRLFALCRLVAEASRRAIPVHRPVTGEAAFQHESGIHCHALDQDRLSYQPFDPREAGRADASIVIGKHSGTSSIRQVLHDRGIEVTPAHATALLDTVRLAATRRKCAISPAVLESIWRTLQAAGRTERVDVFGEVSGERRLDASPFNQQAGRQYPI